MTNWEDLLKEIEGEKPPAKPTERVAGKPQPQPQPQPQQKQQPPTNPMQNTYNKKSSKLNLSKFIAFYPIVVATVGVLSFIYQVPCFIAFAALVIDSTIGGIQLSGSGAMIWNLLIYLLTLIGLALAIKATWQKLRGILRFAFTGCLGFLTFAIAALQPAGWMSALMDGLLPIILGVFVYALLNYSQLAKLMVKADEEYSHKLLSAKPKEIDANKYSDPGIQSLYVEQQHLKDETKTWEVIAQWALAAYVAELGITLWDKLLGRSVDIGSIFGKIGSAFVMGQGFQGFIQICIILVLSIGATIAVERCVEYFIRLKRSM